MNLVQTVMADSLTKQQARAQLEELEFAAQKEGREVAEFSFARAEIEAVPELTIFSAREVTAEVMASLSKKARSWFGTKLFLEFKIDRELLGGAALVWKGEYRDYSLRKRFEEIYKN